MERQTAKRNEIQVGNFTEFKKRSKSTRDTFLKWSVDCENSVVVPGDIVLFVGDGVDLKCDRIFDLFVVSSINKKNAEILLSCQGGSGVLEILSTMVYRVGRLKEDRRTLKQLTPKFKDWKE